MKIGMLLVFGAYMLWGTIMAQQQQPKPHARGHNSNGQKQVIPPTHVVIDPPFPTVSNHPQNQPANAQTPEKPLPRYFRPEWVIVYSTTVYVFFTRLTLWTISRHANPSN